MNYEFSVTILVQLVSYDVAVTVVAMINEYW